MNDITKNEVPAAQVLEAIGWSVLEHGDDGWIVKRYDRDDDGELVDVDQPFRGAEGLWRKSADGIAPFPDAAAAENAAIEWAAKAGLLGGDPADDDASQQPEGPAAAATDDHVGVVNGFEARKAKALEDWRTLVRAVAAGDADFNSATTIERIEVLAGPLGYIDSTLGMEAALDTFKRQVLVAKERDGAREIMAHADAIEEQERQIRAEIERLVEERRRIEAEWAERQAKLDARHAEITAKLDKLKTARQELISSGPDELREERMRLKKQVPHWTKQKSRSLDGMNTWKQALVTEEDRLKGLEEGTQHYVNVKAARDAAKANHEKFTADYNEAVQKITEIEGRASELEAKLIAA